MTHKSELDHDEICKMHLEDLMSISDIKSALSVSYDRIKDIIVEKTGNLPYREKELRYLRLKRDVSKELLEQMHFDECMAVYHISKKYCVSDEMVYLLFKEYGLTPDAQRQFRKKYKNLELTTVKELDNEGLTFKEIRDKLGITDSVLRKFLKENNFKLMTPEARYVHVNKRRLSDKEFLAVYDNKTFNEIKEQYGVDHFYLMRLYEKFKVARYKKPTLQISLSEQAGEIYRDTNNSHDVAKELNISQYTAHSILVSLGLISEKKERLSEERSTILEEAIAEYLKGGITIRQLSSQYEIPDTLISITLKERGIEVKSCPTDHYRLVDGLKWWEENKDSVIQDYVENDYSLVSLSKKYKKGDTWLSRKLKDAGVQIRASALVSENQRKISNLLTDVGISHDLNDRTVIAPYELDIVIPQKKIAIEYHGLYWHCELTTKKDRHKEKLDLAEAQGYRLIQIFEDEYVNKKEIVERKILNILGVSKEEKIFARKCSIESISIRDRKEFLNRNHIQGDGRGTVNICLKHNGVVVAVMNFIEEKNKVFNLNRFATSCNVVGGFSKLLKHFIKTHDFSQIYTFADLRWSKADDNVYIKNGFEYVYTSPPNYGYTKDFLSRESRQKFMKKKLKGKLSHYDSSKTEVENMVAHGYYRVYDCGNAKFVYRT